MKKIRLIRTMIVEYEPDPKYYVGDDLTIEEMALIDSVTDDRETLFNDCDSDEITWEIIEYLPQDIDPTESPSHVVTEAEAFGNDCRNNSCS